MILTIRQAETVHLEMNAFMDIRARMEQLVIT
jgi:hypothetical protein